MAYVRSIPVLDENGAELTVYDFRDRRFVWNVRRMKLCTGEAVERTAVDTFIVVSTGEELLQVQGAAVSRVRSTANDCLMGCTPEARQ